MRKTLLLIIIILAARLGFAQDPKLEWGVGFFAVADNREYKKEQHQIPQSILGAWLVPEVGLRFDSVNHLRAGVGLQTYFGSNADVDQLEYVLYYHYNLAPFEFYIGKFPSRSLLSDYPGALLYDSITDLRLNMGGIFWKIFGKKWNTNLWLDWTGRQSNEQRETFLVGISGKYNLHNFYLAGQSYMNHFALTSNSDTSQHIVDNGMARVCVGFDLSSNTILDSLNFNLGYLGSYSRDRGVDKRYIFASGFIGEIMLEKFGLGVKNTFYFGNNQMRLYDKYGSALYWGDPFYQNTLYNRTDFYIQIFDTDRVQARFTWSMHAAEKILSHQQVFTINIGLDNAQKKGKRLSNRNTLAGWFRK